MFFKNLVKKQADRLAGRHGAVVFMPMKTGDVEVVESFAKPLREQLLATGLGDVTGYALRPGRFDEPSGIEIRLQLASAHPRALQSVAKILDDMDAPVGSIIEFTETKLRHQFGRTEGVAVELDPGAEWLDFAEAAVETLGGTASYQGSRLIAGRRRLYFYGENATNIAMTIRAAAQLDTRIGEVEATRLT